MPITITWILWLIMLVLLVGLFPQPTGWGKLALWAGLVLLTIVLVLIKVVTLT